MEGPEKDSNLDATLSVNHVVVFYDSQNSEMFVAKVRGDYWLVTKDTTFLAEHTVECLDELVETQFTRATKDDLEGCDVIQRYIAESIEQ
jgi:hypothetical protein